MGFTATVISAVGLDSVTGGKGDDAVTGGRIRDTRRALTGGPKMAAPPSAPEGLVSEDAMQNASAMRARRQRQLAVSAEGRNQTILTGPQGILGSAPGTPKTLLGS